MSAETQSLLTLTIVLGTLGIFLWGALRKKKPGCGAGCGCAAKSLRKP